MYIVLLLKLNCAQTLCLLYTPVLNLMLSFWSNSTFVSFPSVCCTVWDHLSVVLVSGMVWKSPVFYSKFKISDKEFQGLCFFSWHHPCNVISWNSFWWKVPTSFSVAFLAISFILPQTRGVHIFQKSKSCLKIVGASAVIWSKFHDENPKILGTAIIIIMYFPPVDLYRITKSKCIWKLSHLRENKE